MTTPQVPKQILSAGNVKSPSALIEMHYRHMCVYWVLVSRGLQKADALDLQQQVMLALYCNPRQLMDFMEREYNDQCAFLAQAAIWRANSFYRDTQRTKENQEKFFESSHAKTFYQMTSDSLFNLLSLGPDALSTRERLILLLRFDQCLTLAEIAEEVGLSTTRVHQILSEIRRRLEDQLDWYKGD